MRRWIFGCAAFALGAAASMIAARGQAPGERAQDASAIRAHIESIFQAFIDKDVAKLQVTHGKNWRGFLTGSTGVIRGIDQYMQAAGGGRLPKGQGMVGYRMSDFDVVFYGDTAVALFVADLDIQDGNRKVPRSCDSSMCTSRRMARGIKWRRTHRCIRNRWRIG